MTNISPKGMTMHAKDDPKGQTGQCERCRHPVSRLHTSTFANDLRTWLCSPCQSALADLLSKWLDTPDGVSLYTRCDRFEHANRCMHCCVPEHYRILSVYDDSLLIELCYECQRELTARVKAWVLEFKPPAPLSYLRHDTIAKGRP